MAAELATSDAEQTATPSSADVSSTGTTNDAECHNLHGARVHGASLSQVTESMNPDASPIPADAVAR